MWVLRFGGLMALVGALISRKVPPTKTEKVSPLSPWRKHPGKEGVDADICHRPCEGDWQKCAVRAKSRPYCDWPPIIKLHTCPAPGLVAICLVCISHLRCGDMFGTLAAILRRPKSSLYQPQRRTYQFSARGDLSLRAIRLSCWTCSQVLAECK